MKSKFKIILLIYTIVLVIISAIFIKYVYDSLVLYNDYQEENYIKTRLDNGEIANMFKDKIEASKYENVELNSDTLKKIYSNPDIKINKTGEQDDIYTYDVSLNDKVITTVDLKASEEFTRLTILNIKKWEISNVEFKFDGGLYEYEIDIPYSYKLIVNNNEVTEYTETNDSKFNNIVEFDKDLIIKKYELNGFIVEPKIEIKDSNDKTVEYEIKDNKIEIQNEYKTISYEELSLDDEINIMEFAKNWSLYMSNDLGGLQNGFGKLKNLFIEDSYMYNLAERWSKGPEIYDQTAHTFKAFENESIESCTRYSENTFSCEIKLDKILRITSNSSTRTVSMHENIFYTYYEGSYKISDMQSA